MRFVVNDHEVIASAADRLELEARRLVIFASDGESYVFSENADGSIRIEAPRGKLALDIISADPLTAQAAARGSCRACAARAARGLDGPCVDCARSAASATKKPPGWSGPKLLSLPEPKTVECDTCGGTIQYMPTDLKRQKSLPNDDNPGRMAVKCPAPRCGGLGYPR